MMTRVKNWRVVVGHINTKRWRNVDNSSTVCSLDLYVASKKPDVFVHSPFYLGSVPTIECHSEERCRDLLSPDIRR